MKQNAHEVLRSLIGKYNKYPWDKDTDDYIQSIIDLTNADAIVNDKQKQRLVDYVDLHNKGLQNTDVGRPWPSITIATWLNSCK